MKKCTLALFLCLVLCLSLTGCFLGIPQVELIDLQEVTLEEAEKLNDLELTETVFCRLEACGEEEFADLTEPEQVMYTVLWYQEEVEFGGLCEYLFSKGPLTSPYLPDALTAIGAVEYRDLLEEFAEENGFDLSDADRFRFPDILKMERYKQYANKYPFDEFDEAFYALEEASPLEGFCSAYIRNHLDDFFS